MILDPSLQMMLAALFPGHVKVEFVPNDWQRVYCPIYDPNFTSVEEEPPEDAEMIGIEQVELEQIADDVWAGMSSKTKVVFVRMGE